jgi:hypothetical protein
VRAFGEVREVVRSEACGGLSQALSIGGEESAQRAAALPFLEPGLSALGAAVEAFENSRELGRDHGVAVAEKPARVVGSVIIRHREPADRHREDFCKFCHSARDPFFAVERAVSQQESAANAAVDAVIPAGYGSVYQACASHRHRWFSVSGWQRIPKVAD